MNFSQYASKLIDQSIFSTTSTAAVDQPIFFSTYDIAEEDDDDGGDGVPLDRAAQSSDNRGTMWERSRTIPRISRGWKAHASTAEMYGERYEIEEETNDDDDSSSSISSSTHSVSSLSPPAAFLSRPTPSSAARSSSSDPAPSLTEPLIQPSTLYIYPSSSRGVGGRIELRKYRNSSWIVVYGSCLIAVAVMGLRELIASGSKTIHPVIPALPTLLLLSLLSVIGGISALAYLVLVQNAVRHLILLSLVGGPAGLVFVGIGSFTGSYGEIGHDERWKAGLRIFSLVCFVGALILGSIGLKRRKQASRTIKVLELTSSIVLHHSPLLLLCLCLSLFSTVLTLPLLSILARLLAEGTLSFSSKSSSLFVLVVWVWTLGIIRGVQRVTVAGVVGSWYFDRHEPHHPSAIEVSRRSFSRAIGPSLGTVIAASLVVAIFETLSILARKARSIIQSSRLPSLLSPLTYLAPILAIVARSLDVFGGYCLCYTGLTGDDLMMSARKAKDLLSNTGTLGLVDNLLTKLILNVTAFTVSLLAGLISFLIISSRMQESSYLPLVATLCFAIPFSTIRLCSNVLADASDTLFLTWNIDLDTGSDHCVKAKEAFGEPDGESLA